MWVGIGYKWIGGCANAAGGTAGMKCLGMEAGRFDSSDSVETSETKERDTR